ncbi:MAG: hypothetical protein MK110_13915 [Fuerstiella sp.]|nr:hypothetical protein [Fuerstiella sp.]
MNDHHIDLKLGESIEIDGHTVTVHRIDDVQQQAVLEIEGPDGRVETLTVSVSQLHEPVLV